MKQCNHCGQLKDEEEFYWRWKSLGIRASCCKSCKKEQDSAWYECHKTEHRQNVRKRLIDKRDAAREYVWDYLSTHPCVDCGETNPVVLEFDHLFGKEAYVSKLVGDGASIERLETEISRCQVLCANCHRKKTSAEREWYKK